MCMYIHSHTLYIRYTHACVYVHTWDGLTMHIHRQLKMRNSILSTSSEEPQLWNKGIKEMGLEFRIKANGKVIGRTLWVSHVIDNMRTNLSLLLKSIAKNKFKVGLCSVWVKLGCCARVGTAWEFLQAVVTDVASNTFSCLWIPSPTTSYLLTAVLTEGQLHKCRAGLKLMSVEPQ